MNIFNLFRKKSEPKQSEDISEFYNLLREFSNDLREDHETLKRDHEDMKNKIDLLLDNFNNMKH